ncbi:MAG: cadherin-like domain-containing protein, partial [Gammaproteobacteria bacterium]|nr:cadherin-like domain-containing protein [Gammaproteobacteria bacterium]
MSTAANWVDAGGQRYAVAPGTFDTLLFDGNGQEDCVFDENANDSFAAIVILATYGNQIRMDLNVDFWGVDIDAQNNVRPDVESKFDNADIWGLALPLPTMTFDGSPLVISSCQKLQDIKIVNENQNVVTIGNGNSTWDGVKFWNRGTVNWSTGNTIWVMNTTEITNFQAATFNIMGAGKIGRLLPDDPAESMISNRGDVNITSGPGDVARVEIDFENDGSLFITGSKLSMTGDGIRQRGANARTVLSNSGLLSLDGPTTGFFLNGGWLAGVGMIVGSVSTADPVAGRFAGNLAGQAGVIHPGVLNQPGTLTIRGSLYLHSNASVVFDIDANGNIAQLVVENPPGEVTNGVLFSNVGNPSSIVLRRNPGFVPADDWTADYFIAPRFVNDNFRVFTLGGRWGNQNTKGLSSARFSNGNVLPALRRAVMSAYVGNFGAAAVNIGGGEPGLLAIFQDDPDFSAPIYVSAISGNANDVGSPVATEMGGTITVYSDGAFEYTSPDYFVGQDSVEYSVSDGTTSKDTTLLVDVPNTSPNVDDVSYSAAHDTTLSVEIDDYAKGLLDFAFNFDDANLAITEVNDDDEAVATPTATTEGGSVTVNADGSFEYTAPASYIGDDTFTVRVGDGVASEVITVTIHLINTIALDAEYSTLKNQYLSVSTGSGLLANAEDVDGDALTVTKINGSTGNVGTSVTLDHGTLYVYSTGAFNFTPTTGYIGDQTFTYTVDDGISESTATVTLHIVKTLASDGEFSVLHDETLTAPDSPNIMYGILHFAS